MAKKSTISHSASDDDSKNESEHSAHSNTLRKKNKSNTGKGKSKSKSRGAGTRAENWSVAQTTFLVHLYGNNMLSPELPLKLPAWNIIVAAMLSGSWSTLPYLCPWSDRWHRECTRYKTHVLHQ
ncbi:BQ5605_C003g02036 [Microbotryum silenes-dioicae]|uniref:BQ5605_C003g02036 protein n=1 Tax=Microbotryum silenes-dioicae TaxID=796604 RepID=A0A2X0NXV0_9BASI|nr:BQ5605_C003g02036 [Microbotryum silenes-dioicae]